MTVGVFVYLETLEPQWSVWCLSACNIHRLGFLLVIGWCEFQQTNERTVGWNLRDVFKNTQKHTGCWEAESLQPIILLGLYYNIFVKTYTLILRPAVPTFITADDPLFSFPGWYQDSSLSNFDLFWFFLLLGHNILKDYSAFRLLIFVWIMTKSFAA